MQTRSLGSFTVSAIGLGAMPMSSNNDNEIPEESQSIGTIHAALDAGITLIDTADIYAPSWDTMGHNETVVRKAMAAYSGTRDEVVIATKGGVTRSDGEKWGRDASLPYLRSAVEKSLRNLGVDVIDVYQWHRPDRSMAYGEGVENFKTLRDEGKVKAIGISNANVEEIEVAINVLGHDGLVSVQNEFSPKFRCSEEVLAWELSLGDHVIPIPGARRPQSITDSAKAADLVLSDEELARCSASGGRRGALRLVWSLSAGGPTGWA